MIIKTVKIFPFFFLICTLIFGQSKSNLEIINELVDSSTSKIIAHLDDFQSTYKINLDSPQEYFTLNQKVINSFAEKGLKIDLDSSANTIIYSLVKVGVEYTNLFKDGLLGGYLMERKTTIIGDFSFQKMANKVARLSACHAGCFGVVGIYPSKTFVFNAGFWVHGLFPERNS